MDRSLTDRPHLPRQRLAPPGTAGAALPGLCVHSPSHSPTLGKTSAQTSPYAEVEVRTWETGTPAALETPTLDRKSRPWAA